MRLHMICGKGIVSRFDVLKNGFPAALLLYNAHESATHQSRRMPASVPPMIICWVLAGTSQDLNSDRYWLTTCSIPSRPASDPKIGRASCRDRVMIEVY